MKIVTSEQMNIIDKIAITSLGVPSIALMENAAIKVVEQIILDLKSVRHKKITILAGKGNNGGDALAIARHLHIKLAEVVVILLANQNELKTDCFTNFNWFEKIGGLVISMNNSLIDVNYIKDCINSSDIIIDGILGTGITHQISDNIKQIIDIVNSSEKFVLSVDVPSGLDSNTGAILGSCIKASKTVTFSLPKLGQILYPGSNFVGDLVVVDIGIPNQAIENKNINIKTNLITNNMVRELIPKRPQNSNKSTFGKVLILSGSTGMTGSGCLAAKACLRAGAGLVYLGVPASLTAIYCSVVPEAVVIPLNDHNGHLDKSSISTVLNQLDGVDVVAMGPGLSTDEDIIDIVQHIIKSSKLPLIIDADALNILSKDIKILKKMKAQAVLTPHPGEMSRLTSNTIEYVQANRLDIARKFSSENGVITVLKGNRTIISCPESDTYINLSGNSGLSTAGTGDVLTGVIASLIAQGLSPLNAAISGVHIHGIAADMLSGMKCEHGIIASDIVDMLPFAICHV